MAERRVILSSGPRTSTAPSAVLGRTSPWPANTPGGGLGVDRAGLATPAAAGFHRASARHRIA